MGRRPQREGEGTHIGKQVPNCIHEPILFGRNATSRRVEKVGNEVGCNVRGLWTPTRNQPGTKARDGILRTYKKIQEAHILKARAMLTIYLLRDARLRFVLLLKSWG